MTGARLDDGPDEKIPGILRGVVTNNADPRGLGRVRVRVPGIFEPESGWAFPLGVGSGAPQRGTFWPPEVKSSVAVWCEQGDPDSLFYLGGHYGERRDSGTEVPTLVKDVAPEDGRHECRAFEWKHFLIFVDDRDADLDDPGSGRERLLIRHKDSGTEDNGNGSLEIEIDGTNRVLSLRGLAGVNIESVGLVNIRGLQVQLQGRVVNPLVEREI